jgi:uncharacterized protein
MRSLELILSEARTALEREYGSRLAQVVLFGCHARGDAVSGSDIDLLVVLRGDVSAGAEIQRMSRSLAALSLRHDTVVSCVFISEDRFHGENSPFLINVRREGIAA